MCICGGRCQPFDMPTGFDETTVDDFNELIGVVNYTVESFHGGMKFYLVSNKPRLFALEYNGKYYRKLNCYDKE
jgi:hypothetical protein